MIFDTNVSQNSFDFQLWEQATLEAIYANKLQSLVHLNWQLQNQKAPSIKVWPSFMNDPLKSIS